MKLMIVLFTLAAACGTSILTVAARANADVSIAASPFEIDCAPFTHAQGTIMRVKIVRASDEAEVTIGAPSFNVPTSTESYPLVQKISDTHGRTVHYQANNFVLTLDRTTSTAVVHFMFNGEEKMFENMVCRN